MLESSAFLAEAFNKVVTVNPLLLFFKFMSLRPTIFLFNGLLMLAEYIEIKESTGITSIKTKFSSSFRSESNSFF